MYFKFENHRLVSAENPEHEILGKMASLLNPAYPPNQTEFRKLAADNLGIKRKVFDKLLRNGQELDFWYSKKTGIKNRFEYFRGANVSL